MGNKLNLSTLGLALFCCMGAGPSVPQSRENEPFWAKQFVTKQAELQQPGTLLIMMGDSIIWELQRNINDSWGNFSAVWNRHFACRHAVNLGFPGDTTANLLWRIENGELNNVDPKVVLVLIGTNNLRLSLHWSTQQTTLGIEHVVEVIHGHLPRAKIFLLGILPRASPVATQEAISTINDALKLAYQGTNVTFFDESHVFLHSGQLNRNLYLTPQQSPLHPNAQGWEMLAADIEPSLGKILPIPGGGAICSTQR